jgi:hypothetical protein
MGTSTAIGADTWSRDHLLRDAQRALTKLTVFRLDEEPVKAQRGSHRHDRCAAQP